MSEGTGIYYSNFWGISGIFPKSFHGCNSYDGRFRNLATFRVNYYAWTSCCHGQRQWALDLSELLSNDNLHHQ